MTYQVSSSAFHIHVQRALCVCTHTNTNTNSGNLLHTLFECVNANDVSDMFVNGKLIMKDREVLTMDEERILYDAKKYQESL